ncbi:MAG TPA: glycosyltransferase family 4 protein [Sandaracinaceae bacterium]
MARVLFVSKPLVPPWNDSGKNLARDVAAGLRRHEPIVMVDRARAWEPPRGRAEPIYASPGRFAPPLSSQVRVLARLAAGPRAELWHFFFAPNPKTSLAARACARLRRARTVQTICSRPRRVDRARSLLFADCNVVLSRRTYQDLLDAGVSRDRLALVAPAVPPLEVPSEEARRAARAALGLPTEAALVVYPGDLELGEGAARTIEAFARLSDGAFLAMACRAKTPGAAAAERALRERARALGIDRRVAWLGETPRIHDLLGTADVVALPSSDPFAKMDLPLVLLEAMWLARPVVVAAGAPAEELADDGAAIAAREDEIATAIASLLDDDGARRALGERARSAAAARFTPSRMAAEYEALYDRVLEERR